MKKITIYKDLFFKIDDKKAYLFVGKTLIRDFEYDYAFESVIDKFKYDFKRYKFKTYFKLYGFGIKLFNNNVVEFKNGRTILILDRNLIMI